MIGKLPVRKRLDLAIREGTAYHDEGEDEVEQKLGVVDATTAIGKDPMTADLIAKILIDARVAIPQGKAVEADLLAG